MLAISLSPSRCRLPKTQTHQATPATAVLAETCTETDSACRVAPDSSRKQRPRQHQFSNSSNDDDDDDNDDNKKNKKKKNKDKNNNKR